MTYRVIAIRDYEEVFRFFKSIGDNLGKDVVWKASDICLFVSDDVPEELVKQAVDTFGVAYIRIK